MATATRKAAWRNGAGDGWHDDFVWYAAAMHRMKDLTPNLDEFHATFIEALPQGFPQGLVAQLAAITSEWSDPMSLGYQSQVHASWLGATSWPTHRGKRAIWHQCAHNHWFFLPWHRAYLLEFEAVAREHIEALGGPADGWGLPYWNYSDHQADPERLGLPKPLRNASLPTSVTVPGVDARSDGTFPNPLFDPTREMTGDADGTSAEWASATQALLRPHYANQQDTGLVSLGGGVLEAPNNAADFHRGREMGELDRQPHGSVHMQVGGGMAVFVTAGLDPVFWIHHCNIDRLWETYARQLGHSYPFHPAADRTGQAFQSWMQQKFTFLMPDGTVKTWTAPELVDVETLGYVYDSTDPPPLPEPPPPPPGAEVEPFGVAPGAPPEPVAAVRNVPLAGVTSTSMSQPANVAAGDLVVAGFGDEARWVLRLTGIRALRPTLTSYEVYLGLASSDEPDPTDATHYVGLLSLFGVYEASRDDGSSPADGQMRMFDISPQVTALGPTFDIGTATIRLVPLNPDRDLEAAAMSIDQITIEVA